MSTCWFLSFPCINYWSFNVLYYILKVEGPFLYIKGVILNCVSKPSYQHSIFIINDLSIQPHYSCYLLITMYRTALSRFLKKLLIYHHYKQLFQQNLSYLYPSSVSWFFLVQFTDELAVIVDGTILLHCQWCRGSPRGTSSQSCIWRWHWSSSCPLPNSSLFSSWTLDLLVFIKTSWNWRVLFCTLNVSV